jgi:uncharacterized membrane protein
LVCAGLKAVAFLALALILVEPLLARSRPRRGANAFAILADNSQSLSVADRGGQPTRGDWIRAQVPRETPWQTRLAQDFDVRRYAFDSHLRAEPNLETLTFDGHASALGSSLMALSRRFRNLPLAGVLVFTDGNRTDQVDLDWESLPPIYPVIPPADAEVRDLAVRDVSVSQTNFEAAPVVLRAEVHSTGLAGQRVAAEVLDEAGKVVEHQEAAVSRDGSPLSFRFQFRPALRGLGFYTVRTALASEPPSGAGEAPTVSIEPTLANNARTVVVDQGGGPYRILYVSGRPNWDFKYLHRALRDDEQIDLVGLIRIARRQPKFDFQSSAGPRTTSPLFQGFDNPDGDTAETADQPVLKRVDTADETELRDGFPRTAEALYAYSAIVLDDVEAGFFSPDQLQLLRNFVSTRGGGLLMLGSADSFGAGQYDRTPVGDLLPVYLTARDAAVPAAGRRLVLTREGWLQPWVRTRKTEDEERARLDRMPDFRVQNPADRIKPGAAVLAEVADLEGNLLPALVTQSFGKGRTGALLIGDLWRWGMHRETPEESDLERSWRQTARWLVSDVPGRVEVTIRPQADNPSAVDLAVRVRDAEYRPLDNARVGLKLTLPDGSPLELAAEPETREAGLYVSTFVARTAGAYRVVASATSPDGSVVGDRETGWVAQPSADEFARLDPDREFLQTLAERTGGEVIEGGRLDALVAQLPTRRVPVSEIATNPLWHQPVYFLVALIALLAEWGLRRVNGLP